MWLNILEEAADVGRLERSFPWQKRNKDVLKKMCEKQKKREDTKEGWVNWLERVGVVSDTENMDQVCLFQQHVAPPCTHGLYISEWTSIARETTPVPSQKKL